MDEYISTFPSHVQKLLQEIRALIHKAAPSATELISYQIPAFKLNGRNLIYFAGWKDHVSLYPIPNGTPEFDAELSQYKAGKGTVKLPLNKPLPRHFITQMVKLRIQENAHSK